MFKRKIKLVIECPVCGNKSDVYRVIKIPLFRKTKIIGIFFQHLGIKCSKCKSSISVERTVRTHV